MPRSAWGPSGLMQALAPPPLLVSVLEFAGKWILTFPSRNGWVRALRGDFFCCCLVFCYSYEKCLFFFFYGFVKIVLQVSVRTHEIRRVRSHF